MACDVNALLADGACYSCLNEEQRNILELALLASIVAVLDPAADLSPDALMAEAAVYGGANPKQVDLLELSLLCAISEL